MAKNKLETIIEPVVEGLGYETVRVLLGSGNRPTLQVMIDISDGSRAVTVDDCALVSRALSKVLDEVDPIDGEYALEVSSPGIDRPLTKLAHFERFKGYEAKIETVEAVEGRKRIKGTLLGADAKEGIRLLMDGKEYKTTLSNISKAKLVLTDELLAQFEAGQNEDNKD